MSEKQQGTGVFGTKSTKSKKRLARLSVWQDRSIAITKIVALVSFGISFALFVIPGILSGAIFGGRTPAWVQQAWDLSLKAIPLGIVFCLIGLTSYGMAWFAYRVEKRRKWPRANAHRTFECPCCGYLTFEHKPPGTYEICPVCWWEDDPVQYRDPEYPGGANEMSLNQARANYRLFGATDKDAIRFVRRPFDSEKP